MSFSLGIKLLVPMGLVHTQHTKHFSCHWRVLYSIFFIPALNTSLHASHLAANWES